MVLAIVAFIFVLRPAIVPSDFGVHEAGYMYGWHRKGNEEEWKAFKIKFRTSHYCRDCHKDQYQRISQSPHFIIECENCHGLAFDHPDNPAKLSIERARSHCLRCHALLPYRQTGRALIKGVIPETHNPQAECVLCHNPHAPQEGFSKETGRT